MAGKKANCTRVRIMQLCKNHSAEKKRKIEKSNNLCMYFCVELEKRIRNQKLLWLLKGKNKRSFRKRGEADVPDTYLHTRIYLYALLEVESINKKKKKKNNIQSEVRKYRRV